MEGRGSYLLRRLLWVPPVLFIVSVLTFMMARLGPGDPVRIAAGQFRDPEAFDRVRAARGLDKPVWRQYTIYMQNVLTKGDFGESFRYRDRRVNEIIFPAIYRSMQYNAVALTITLSVGLVAGVFAARQQGTWVDPTSISFFLALQSIHGLIFIPLLLLVFSLKLDLLPASGWPRDCPVQLPALGADYSCIGVLSREAIIPLVVLSIPGIASWARFTRAFTLDVLREDYIRTARSKGLSERTVLMRHVLRNALLPLSTMIGFALIGLLEGSFFTETLTGIPGIGRLAFESIFSRDYDMIMALTMLGTTVFVVAVIAIDIMYTFIDPRIRLGARSS
jgi:ABC-type dipeptide/oligopeptide/nickel transport system permease component